MTQNLGVDRKIYDACFYDAMNTFTTDLSFYLDYALRARGEVLELCCGTGRLTIPMAKAGIRITGLDFTKSMLTRAKEKAKSAGLDIPFIKEDMRAVRLRKKFKMIFIPFYSLLNTYTIEDTERVFETVRRHLAPGGRFLFDVFNPRV
ncbi:class I SAM-dependent methyltransferase [Bdellovibrionota bacterium FG-2]